MDVSANHRITVLKRVLVMPDMAAELVRSRGWGSMKLPIQLREVPSAAWQKAQFC
jgi:hypothetical protein